MNQFQLGSGLDKSQYSKQVVFHLSGKQPVISVTLPREWKWLSDDRKRVVSVCRERETGQILAYVW